MKPDDRKENAVNPCERTLRALRIGILGLAALAACAVLSAQAPVTVRDLLSGVLHKRSAENYFVIPVAGHVVGVHGDEFRTDVTISSAAPTRIAVAWMAQDADNSARPLSFFDIGPRPAFFENMVEASLHVTGLGALVVAAIRPDGSFDQAARISGFARVWTAAAGCSGTSSVAIRPGQFGNGGSAYGVSAYGIRLDAGHRANLGLVNPNPVTIAVHGYISSEEFEVSVPPFSMRQVPIAAPAVPSPDGSISVTYLSASGGAFFAGYAVSVDQVSGDGWLVSLSE
jgi:hypothetical protein